MSDDPMGGFRFDSDPRGSCKHVPPPSLSVPIEDAPCAKCAELTKQSRMRSETMGRYVDDNLALQNRLAHLAALNKVLLTALSDLSHKYGEER